MNSPANPCSSVTGLVLAGGRGLRMGGIDKGLIERDGRTLVEHVLDALRPQVGMLIVSANRNHERYRALGIAVVADELPDFAGPLAGIAAAGATTRSDWIVCVPCDTLALPADLVVRLLGAAQRAGADAAYVEDADGPQFVFCLLHRRLLPSLARAAASPRPAVRDFLRAHGAVAVPFREWRCANLNTPESLAC